MNKLSLYGCLLYILCSCNGNSGDLMRLVAERDSLKAMAEKQEMELKNNKAAIQAINSAIDSIAVHEGLLFTSSSNETPVTKDDALRNIERFQSVIDQQRQKIAALQAQLAGNPKDENLQGIVEYLNQQLSEKNAQIANLKQELSKKDVDISRLKKMVESQRLKIDEQSDAIAQLDKKNKAQTTALTNQDKYINTCYVLIGTKDDLKRKGIIRGTKLLADGALDKSKFARVDIRNFKEISFEAKRPRILTNIPTSAYTLTTSGKNQFTLHITNVTAFWSISNFLIIQTN